MKDLTKSKEQTIILASKYDHNPSSWIKKYLNKDILLSKIRKIKKTMSFLFKFEEGS